MNPSQIGQTTPPAQIDPSEPYLNDFDQRNLSELSKLYDNGQIGAELKGVDNEA